MRRTVITLALAAMFALAIAAVAAAATAPAATTGPTASTSETMSVLEGVVNPNGASTTYYFQWGTTTAYGTTAKTAGAGSGTQPRAVHTTATALTPGTVYHYRLVATNAFGTTYGDDASFTTYAPPDPVTTETTALSSTGARLAGTVNPHGLPITYSFEYGTTTAYGVRTSDGELPGATAPIQVSATLRGLEPGTIFHYRLIAWHSSAHAAYGHDQLFMTYPLPRDRRTPRVTVRTATHRPYPNLRVVTVSGRIRRPAAVPAAFACTGRVRVTAATGTHRLRSFTTPLSPTCTFTAKLRFGGKRRAQQLRIESRFAGNHYLAAAPAQPIVLTLR